MTPRQGETLDYLIELARSLHIYGASADRLEAAVTNASLSLGMGAAVFSTPTMLTLVFQFPDEAGKRVEITRLLRVIPSSIDLDKMTQTDKLGDLVVSDRMTPGEGLEGLKTLQQRAPLFPTWLRVFAYGLSSIGVCALFGVSWVELFLSFVVGLMVGTITELSRADFTANSLHEAIAGFVAAATAKMCARLVPELATETVILSGLVVLFPGLMMTVALRELSTQNLASGVARFAGALTTLLKIIVGVALGTQLIQRHDSSHFIMGAQIPLTDWLAWILLPITVLSFAILFRAPLRKVPLIMIAVVTGLVASRAGSAFMGPNFGIFFAGLSVGVVSNIIARIYKRPASVTLVPGIIMLVPGSLTYRSLVEFWSADAVTGVQNGVNAMFFAAALAAGLLFGNLILPPRRNL